MTRILIVEPDLLYRKLFPIWIRNHFGGDNLEVPAVAGVNEAEDAARNRPPDVLLTAFELGGETNGWKLAKRLHRECGELRVVLISQGVDYAKLRRRLARLPHSQFLAKPVGETTFVDVMSVVLRRGQVAPPH